MVILPRGQPRGGSGTSRGFAIEDKGTDHSVSGQVDGDGHDSVGVSVFPQHGTSLKELMISADAALYEAKRGGRERVASSQVVEEAATPAAANRGVGVSGEQSLCAA